MAAWIDLELEEVSEARDRAAANVAALRERGMKLRGEGPTWRTEVETDDLAVAREVVVSALASVDERWADVLAVRPARG